MTTTIPGRWGRLAADLDAAGIDVRVDERSYPGGVSRSITLRNGDSIIHIGDQWWRKNPDIWIGWQVHVEDADSIVTREFPLTKKRGEVVTAIRKALGHDISDMAVTRSAERSSS